MILPSRDTSTTASSEDSSSARSRVSPATFSDIIFQLLERGRRSGSYFGSAQLRGDAGACIGPQIQPNFRQSSRDSWPRNQFFGSSIGPVTSCGKAAILFSGVVLAGVCSWSFCFANFAFSLFEDDLRTLCDQARESGGIPVCESH